MWRLNYVFPDGQVVTLDKVRDFSDQNILSWLYSMIESAPDVIFFYTIETTDIWS